MQNSFSIKKMREAIHKGLALLHSHKEVEATADEGFKLDEKHALEIISLLPGLFEFDKNLEEANATSVSTQRRAVVQIRLRGPFHELDYHFNGLSLQTEVSNEQALQFLDSNKLIIILWRAYMAKVNCYQINTRDTFMEWSMYVNTYLENQAPEYEISNYSKLLDIFTNLEEAFNQPLTPGMVNDARRRFASLRENITDRIDFKKQNDAENASEENQSKFSKMLKGGEIVEQSVIEEQLLKVYELLPGNGLVARTWGFEIESPDAKGVDAPTGIEKGEDGSLRSYERNSDCDCSCNDCQYHDCDCDLCDNRSDGDDHCGSSDCASADSAEFRTIGGVQRIISSGLYTLCKDLNDSEAENNDTAGTHIHVYAKDLNTNQIGYVLASYKRLEELMAVICGREDVAYAKNIPVEYIRAALRKNNPTITTDKPRAVTTVHLTNNRGTIEFRQMDCNYDANRITVWAWICRALVTSAKRGMKLNDVLGVTDIVSLIEVFAKFNVFLHDESPEQVVYGSKTDSGSFTQQSYEVA